MLLFLSDKNYEKEVTVLFLSSTVLCITSFFSMINRFSSFLFLFFLLHNVIYLGIFSKMKKIINRRLAREVLLMKVVGLFVRECVCV